MTIVRNSYVNLPGSYKTKGGGAPPSLSFIDTYNPDIAIATVDLTGGSDPNVVRLKRSTSLNEADFTASEFTIANITTWAGGEDVEVVKMYDQSGNANDLTFNSEPFLISGGTMYTYTDELSNTYPVIDFLNNGFDWGDFTSELASSSAASFTIVNRGDAGTSENEVCMISTAETDTTYYVGRGENAGAGFPWFSNAGTPSLRINRRVYPIVDAREFQAFAGENTKFDIQTYENVDITGWVGRGLRFGNRSVSGVPQTMDFSGQLTAFIAHSSQPDEATRIQMQHDLNDFYNVYPVPVNSPQNFIEDYSPEHVYSLFDLRGDDPYVCLMSYGFQYYKAFRVSQIEEAGMTQWAFRNSALQDIDIFKFYNQIGDTTTLMTCDMEVTRNETYFTQTTAQGNAYICGQVNDSLDWADLDTTIQGTNLTWSLILGQLAGDSKFVYFGTQVSNTSDYLGYGNQFLFTADADYSNLPARPPFYINGSLTAITTPNILYDSVNDSYLAATYTGINNTAWTSTLRVFPRDVSLEPGVNASFDGNFLGYISKDGSVDAGYHTALNTIFETTI